MLTLTWALALELGGGMIISSFVPIERERGCVGGVWMRWCVRAVIKRVC